MSNRETLLEKFTALEDYQLIDIFLDNFNYEHCNICPALDLCQNIKKFNKDYSCTDILTAFLEEG